MVGKGTAVKLDMMLNLPEKCHKCKAPYDKKSKEMAMTWFVDVYEQQHLTILTCPTCREKRENEPL
jgi:uncharacterized protein with PIN domain